MLNSLKLFSHNQHNFFFKFSHIKMENNTVLMCEQFDEHRCSVLHKTFKFLKMVLNESPIALLFKVLKIVYLSLFFFASSSFPKDKALLNPPLSLHFIFASVKRFMSNYRV